MLEDERFMRTRLLVGDAGLEKLQQATVMVIGLGAVGGYALEALARSGIGNLILVDFDVFDTSNINRQILALTSTIGMKKTEAAKQRVLEINPACNVRIKEMFVNQETLPELLSEKVDYVVDAIDALNPKCCLIEELYQRQIPFISSMGAALKTNPALIKCGKLSATKNCGLAKFIRKRLKKRGVDLGKICCVASEEQVCLENGGLLLCDDASENITSGGQQGRARNTLGSLPTITAIFGLTIANEIIKKISGL